MKRNLLIAVFLVGTLYNKAQTITDIEGNIYNTVTIGEQIWLVENLKTTKFNNGATIPTLKDNDAWANSTTPEYCWYNNDSLSYNKNYGALYNWYAVNTDNLCPTGWHVPSDSEWTILTNYLGGDSIAGGKLKAVDPVLWKSPNIGATNETGFTALPAGDRVASHGCANISSEGEWWSSSIVDTNFIWIRYVDNYDKNVYRNSHSMNFGHSVRCLSYTVPSSIANAEINKITFYPNPSSGQLYLKNTTSSNSSIVILNLQGEEILIKQNISNFIDISNLKNGIYIAKIIDSGKIVMTKIVKE